MIECEECRNEVLTLIDVDGKLVCETCFERIEETELQELEEMVEQMDEKYKGFAVVIAIIVIGLLTFSAMAFYSSYSERKLETEQPRYFIEFKGNTYELKEVE